MVGIVWLPLDQDEAVIMLELLAKEAVKPRHRPKQVYDAIDYIRVMSQLFLKLSGLVSDDSIH